MEPFGRQDRGVKVLQMECAASKQKTTVLVLNRW